MHIIYWAEVKASGLSSWALCFVAGLLSLPPQYFLPIRQSATVLGFNPNLVVMRICMQPPPRCFLIWKKMILANSLVGDEMDSLFSDSASGLGNSVKFTLLSISLGRSLFLASVLCSLFGPMYLPFVVTVLLRIS